MSYDQFADRAKFNHFLPLMAERFARQRLKALAKVEGKATDGFPVVLFLCVHNAWGGARWLRPVQRLAGDRAVAWSGGSEPGLEVNPAAVEAMAEVSIDITEEFPKPWTDQIVQAADVVITMGCGDACPIFPGKRYEDWPLEDPAGQDVGAVRPIRDEIERRVRASSTRWASGLSLNTHARRPPGRAPARRRAHRQSVRGRPHDGRDRRCRRAPPPGSSGGAEDRGHVSRVEELDRRHRAGSDADEGVHRLLASRRGGEQLLHSGGAAVRAWRAGW